KDGAILANSGHFDNEINISAIEELAKSSEEIRENVREYILKDGRKIYLLAEGRLVNLAAAEGHPSEVMDMSFSNQALVARWIVHEKNLEKNVHPVPEEIDREVARRKLATMGIKIDSLTEVQRKYMQDWKEGT
ncbi:MAG: adenosylhomocysteinase, partial [Chloroflexota bacterium]